MTSYSDFLAAKAAVAPALGRVIRDTDIHPILKPHQRAIVAWAVAGGRRAIFAAFGLGKSIMQLETLRLTINGHGRALIVCPLGVRQEFMHDAAMLGITLTFVNRTEHVAGDGLYITNYEPVRDGKLDPALFDAVSLDEASILRSYGSKTYQTFLTLFASVPYRFVATATPSPNRFKELIHYAGYLGVMDTGQALTRFFQRDSTKAGNLTLFPHKTVEFFMWLTTWAVFLQNPKDICECPCHESRSTSSISGSEGWSPSNGSQRLPAGLGSAPATVETPNSPRQTTSRTAASEVVDARESGTAARELGRIASGAASSPGAPTHTTKTGPTTADGGLLSATGGSPSPTSSPTSARRQSASLSNESTTRADTSLETADGQVVLTKLETPAATESSFTTASPRASQSGPKHSGSTTSPSTRESQSSAGSRSELSCGNCACSAYQLPELAVEYVEVDPAPDGYLFDRDGQGQLVRGVAMSLQDAAREKRDSLAARINAMLELVDRLNPSTDDQLVIWCDLNAEQDAIERALAAAGVTYSSVYGSLSTDEVEHRIHQWRQRETVALIGKPVMLGQGLNLQQANKAIFVGVTWKFNDLIQACHRIQRFGQTRPCTAWIIHAESEREIVTTLRHKWTQHRELSATMTDLIREHGLSQTAVAAALTRSLGVDRCEAAGNGWRVVNNDTVEETGAMEAESVDMIVTSIPFANHYEYTPSYNDFGHTDNNDHFWAQMDYLTPQLLRVLAPGRIYACHVKDRILFGNVTGAGVPTVSPFHAEAIFHAQRHGFDYLGMITVVTDVVRENNQTYRLGWSEMAKDGTKMGVGSPEYVLIFHKPQTDRTRGYADTPVIHNKTDYTRARWQVDAHAFWRSSGQRLLTPDELAALPIEQRSRLFTEQTLRQVYDYESHIRIGEDLDGRGALPATFMSLAPGSWHPDVWHDINRMLTLNGEQKKRNVEMHVCPLQFDIVDRLIGRFSNPGDLVYDPFGGLGTVPLRALQAGRRGLSTELNSSYWLDSVKYLEAEDRKQSMPSLFDLDEAS